MLSVVHWKKRNKILFQFYFKICAFCVSHDCIYVTVVRHTRKQRKNIVYITVTSNRYTTANKQIYKHSKCNKCVMV